MYIYKTKHINIYKKTHIQMKWETVKYKTKALAMPPSDDLK